jgi:hypothetical protein
LLQKLKNVIIYIEFPLKTIATPDEFSGDDTVDLPAPQTIEEGDIEQVLGTFVGTSITLRKISAPSGFPEGTEQSTVVQSGTHAPKHGIHKGQPMYYGNRGQYISRIDHIDRMSDGSYWVHTQNSVYRVEVLDNAGDDTIMQADFVSPDADAETGGNPAGDGRVETRNNLDGLVGGEGGEQ